MLRYSQVWKSATTTEGVKLHTRNDGSMYNHVRLRATTKTTEIMFRDLLFAGDDTTITSLFIASQMSANILVLPLTSK